MTNSTAVLPDTFLSRLLNTVDGLDSAAIARLYDQISAEEQGSIEQHLIHAGLLNHHQLAEFYSNYYLLPLFDPPQDSPLPVDPSLASLLPGEFWVQHQIAPLSDDGKTLEVAVFTPDALVLADVIRARTGLQMRPIFSTLDVIGRVLRALYGDVPLALSPARVAPESAAADVVPAMINRLIRGALRAGASDLMIEPGSESHRVRMRTDRVLKELESVSSDLAAQLIQHLKTLAKLDGTDSKRVQQGRIRVRDGQQRIEVKLRVLPTMAGPRAVMRFVNNSVITLDRLGLSATQYQQVSQSLLQPAGMLLVAGPARSGKRTTLYSCLDAVNASGCKSLCTIEDEIDFNVAGIQQTQVDADDRPAFHQTLRQLIQTDPDVILIDQIRDRQTAELAMNAAISGQFVLGSIAALGPIDMIQSLLDLGLTRNQIANTVRALVYQRLVRRGCKDCERTAQQQSNCPQCRKKGPRGLVCQVVTMDEELQHLIRCGADMKDIQAAIDARGT
jgi:type IV pilus assembly protein PilB